MMDRTLKERIIGAAVLVLVVVLVVPVFLNGPPAEDEIVSEHVTLPGQDDQKSQTVILERDRTAPVPAAVESEPAEEPAKTGSEVQKETPPPPVVAKAAPEPAAKPPVQAAKSAPSATTSPTGMWAVQLGSFGSAENAERLAADLRKQGYAAFLSEVSTKSGHLERVRIGPQKDRASAEAMAEKLKKAGYDGQVVPHP
jgi:DedD protein